MTIRSGASGKNRANLQSRAYEQKTRAAEQRRAGANELRTATPSGADRKAAGTARRVGDGALPVPPPAQQGADLLFGLAGTLAARGASARGVNPLLLAGTALLLFSPGAVAAPILPRRALRDSSPGLPPRAAPAPGPSPAPSPALSPAPEPEPATLPPFSEWPAPPPGVPEPEPVQVFGRYVQVRGTAGDDRISLAEDKAQGELVVAVNGAETRVPEAQWKNATITVKTGPGNDEVDASQLDHGVRFEMGSGNDTARGTSGDDHFEMGSFFVDEPSERDVVVTGAGKDEVTGSNVATRIESGPGQKTISRGLEVKAESVVLHGGYDSERFTLSPASGGQGVHVEASSFKGNVTFDIDAPTLANRSLEIRTWGGADLVNATALSRPLNVSLGSGDDVFLGSTPGTIVDGGDGADALLSSGQSELSGGFGGDIVVATGGGRADGGPEKDILVGGGNATLIGGTSSDLFANVSRGDVVFATPDEAPSLSARPGARVEFEAELDAGRRYAATLFQRPVQVPPDHPYAQYVADMRHRLSAKQLPTRGEGVQVIVFDLGEGVAHGDSVARTLADPNIGIAPGVDLSVLHFDDSRRSRTATPVNTTGNFSEIITSAEHSLAHMVRKLDDAVHEVLETLPGNATARQSDGKPRILNFSLGGSIARLTLDWGVAGSILGQAGTNSTPPGPAYQEAIRRTEQRLGKPWSQVPTLEQHEAIGGTVAEALSAGIAANAAQPNGLRGAQRALEGTLAQAAHLGISVVAAAGNDGEAAASLGARSYSEGLWDGVPGFFRVGAAALNLPLDPADDTIASFSSSGQNITVAAPGVGIPVDTLAGSPFKEVDGTSFASPVVAGVLALMSKPKPGENRTLLTPAELGGYLQRSAHDIANTTADGAGVIDPVRAIELAQTRASLSDRRR